MPMVEASLTLLFLYQTQHVSCSKFGILSGVSCAIKFLFLDLICFMAETLLQTSMRNFSVTEAYFCWLISGISLQYSPGSPNYSPWACFFFRWDILVICLTVVLKLAVTVFLAWYATFRSGRFGLGRFDLGTFRSGPFRSGDIQSDYEILHVHILMQTYLNQREILLKKLQTWFNIQQLISINIRFSLSSASKLNHNRHFAIKYKFFKVIITIEI